MASVRKRKWTHEGVEKEAWVVAYTDQGGKRRLKTFDKKKDADRYRTQVEAEIEAGIHTPIRASVTVGEAYTEYMKFLDRRRKAKEVTTHLIRFHQTVMTRFILPKFRARALSSITQVEFQDFVDEFKLTFSARYTRQLCGAMVSLLQYGVRKKWVKRNILKDDPCDLPIVNKRTDIPSKADIETLMSSLDVNIRSERIHVRVNRKIAINLGLFCGLRPGEICGLHWENIDFTRETIRVEYNYSRHDGLKTPKTDAGKRVIPLTPPVKAALRDVARLADILGEATRSTKRWKDHSSVTRFILREYARDSRPVSMEGRSGFVLLGGLATPRPKELTSKFWWTAMKRAGLWNAEKRRPKFTPHALRHAAASLWIDFGMPPANLKQAIGHASIQTTFDIYAHLFPEDRRTFEIAEKVASAFYATTTRQHSVTS